MTRKLLRVSITFQDFRCEFPIGLEENDLCVHANINQTERKKQEKTIKTIKNNQPSIGFMMIPVSAGHAFG